MARRPVEPKTAVVPPSLSPQRAVELLKTQLAQIDELVGLHWKSHAIEKWRNTTGAILDGAFGKPSDMSNKFLGAGGAFSFSSMPDETYQQDYVEEMGERRAILESCLEQLEILAPPVARVAPGTYIFHAEIDKVSGHLFRDGHYRNAALDAYIRVIEEVKHRSGLPHDGDNLMNQAFGCDGGKVPVLKFNGLSSEADRDEQRAFMYLFKGLVGLRNSKAHSNQIFNDPHRAHDYMSLASLLMRLLELSTR